MTLFIVLFSQLIEAKILVATQAQVKGHVITSREVEIHKLVNDSLGGPLENFKEDSPLEHVIKEWLLFYEASSFYNTKVSQKEAARNVQKLNKKFSLQLKKLSVQTKELKSKVLRRLEADRLYSFKKKASVLPVTLGEIETEYTQNRIRYGNLSFDEAKNQIRQNKVQSNLEKRLNQWFRVLEKKYKVQRFSQYQGSGS